MFGNITDVEGVKVGVITDKEAVTGCTVVTVEGGAVGGVSVKGGAPSTRETALLDPLCRIDEVHGVTLSGGSAFGLDVPGGVMKYLEEKGQGLKRGPYYIPIVPGAVIFDLFLGNGKIKPDASWGYKGAASARAGEIPEGSQGAGTGATVAKALGLESAVKAGQASLSRITPGGLRVGVLVVVNALGDVVDREGKLLAGPRNLKTGEMRTTLEVFKQGDLEMEKNGSLLFREKDLGLNTSLAVVATNARLNKVEANRLAAVAHNGLATAIRPLHTVWDGDAIFALATGEVPSPVDFVGALAMELLEEAVPRALQLAETLGGVPALKDL
ncbi:MAG: peptidase S58 family protein [Candidatus Syntrophonatronum acetioxidans]|uniref:Peptidase S58 family protein n=1 Tax=Candidatus Syntrophonatronum acetioxidans TaxID=1795816 RepID=A0A424YEY5_9FIRM|nr:MAG: peptidase S58 family protein [Candidatus Syntrophonatronum acetioxidans]